MKMFVKLVLGCVAMTLSGSAMAAQELAPVPEHPYVHELNAAPAVPMFHAVKYKDCDEKSPCAKPKIIVVKNPCYDPCDPCKCGQPECVAIEICVPTCGCELVSCRKNGDRVRYDYGKYAIDVRIKKDYIEVDYQD